MLTQGVGNFMAHDRGNFIVTQFELLDDPAIKDDLAARAAVGVELVTLDQVDFPVPLRGIRAKGRRLGNQSVGDRLQAPGVGAGLVQDALGARLADGLLIRLGVHLVNLLARQHAEHVLLALYAHGAAIGGIHRLTAAQQQPGAHGAHYR